MDLLEKYLTENSEEEDKKKWETRAKKEWEKISKEPLEVEKIKGTVYAFGSELATLRLLKKFRDIKKARADYSTNLKKFYFSLDV